MPPRRRRAATGPGRPGRRPAPAPRGGSGMDLIASDILEISRGLSPLFLGALFALGLFLWLFGGRTHRFWLVLLTTVLTGLYGLCHGRDFGMQPLVAGL